MIPTRTTVKPVGGHIVVADDDPAIRALVAYKLTRAGAVVHQAADGAEALEACRKGGIDLALLDIEMPRLTGFEVLAALRLGSDTADLPVLLLTAHSFQGDVVKGLGLGAHDYIRKPFDLDELQARVDSVILLSRRTQELADSEAAFRGLFEGANTAMSIVGMDGALRRVNQAWAELLGRPADSIGSLDTYLLVHPDDRAAYGEVIGEMRSSGVDHVRGRLRVLRPDGEIRWTDTATTLVRDSAGEPAYLYRVMVDITEEVLMERAVLERELRYATLVDHLPGAAVLVVDRALRVLTAGGAALWDAGHEPAALVGQPIEAVLAAADFAFLYPKLAAALDGRPCGTFEFPDSAGRVSLVDAVPLIGDADGVNQILVAIRDITALKHAEDALRSAEQRSRAVFELAPVGMAEISPDGYLSQVNAALADLLGYPQEQLLGQSDIALTHPEDAAGTAEAMSRMASGEASSYRVEKRYVHADGHLIWVALSVVSVAGSSGQDAHLLAHYLDVTERKRSEARLEKLVDQDPLTGLLNRRGFEAALDRQMATVHRYGPGGALLMLDLDNLKWANDTLGHSMGDQLIVSMAELLGSALRETDIVARLGGDEFAVILPRATRAEAETVAARIVRCARDRVGALSGGSGCIPTVSVGVAMFDDAGLSGRTVLGRADLTMYEAKKSGGDRYAFAGPGEQTAGTRGAVGLKAGAP